MPWQCQRFVAIAALPVVLLLLVSPELVCCAVPKLTACGAGDCCAHAEESAAAKECCDGPAPASDPGYRDVAKLPNVGLVATTPAADRFSTAPPPAPRLGDAFYGLPPSDLQTLHSVLLI